MSAQNQAHIIVDRRFDKAKRWSARLRYLSFVILAIWFVLGISMIVWPELLTGQLDRLLAGATYAKPMPEWKIMALLAVFAPPWVLGLYTLWMLAQLFGHYAKGQVFSIDSCRVLKRLGVLLLVSALVVFFSPTLAVLIATSDNPPGEKELMIEISAATIYPVLSGGLLLIIGQIMARARELDEENREFV